MSLPSHISFMALLYILGGCYPFRNPRLYLKIIPPYFSNPKLLNYLSGFAEIILGICLCLPFTSKFASWGIIALLIAVFPANLYMYKNDDASLGLSKQLRLLRLPLQLALIFWAYLYT